MMQKTTEMKLIENLISLIKISDRLRKNFYQKLSKFRRSSKKYLKKQ